MVRLREGKRRETSFYPDTERVEGLVKGPKDKGTTSLCEIEY